MAQGQSLTQQADCGLTSSCRDVVAWPQTGNASAPGHRTRSRSSGVGRIIIAEVPARLTGGGVQFAKSRLDGHVTLVGVRDDPLGTTHVINRGIAGHGFQVQSRQVHALLGQAPRCAITFGWPLVAAAS